MGSPLSPMLANLVLQELEDRAIASLLVSPCFYYRYVDNIIMEASSLHISTILNSESSTRSIKDCSLLLSF